MAETQEMTRDETILAWKDSVAKLAAAKDHEMALRLKLCEGVFNYSPDELRKGTENLELGNGYKLKFVGAIRTTFPNVEQLRATLDQMEKSGKVGALIADRIVRWKPELSATEYEQLPEQFKPMIDACILKKPATPTLEFVEPKASK